MRHVLSCPYHSSLGPVAPARSATTAAATALVLAVAVAVTACSDGDRSPGSVIVFNGEDNRLNAYAPLEGDLKQTVIKSASDAPGGRDINAQICFNPDRSRRFIAGEDTGQPNPPQGWGYFQLEGDAVGSLGATQIGKLTPTYQGSLDNAENYGCGFLSDGRLVTTDVGDQATGPANGQLIIWFPPFDSYDVAYCKLDIEIGTAGGIWVDAGDQVYVASARGDAGIYRYRPPFPTSNTGAGGCGRVDSTGAPLADSISKEKFIAADANILTPNAIVSNLNDGWYVSSVINGVIAEYNAGGKFVRRILEPPADEKLGPEPFSTGTPLGLGIDSFGTVYYADIGIVLRDGEIGPGPKTGTVRKIRFDGAQPLPPETMDRDLDFPDGIGVLEE